MKLEVESRADRLRSENKLVLGDALAQPLRETFAFRRLRMIGDADWSYEGPRV